MIDSSNKDRINESGQELINALNNETLSMMPLLILIHKADNADCMGIDFVTNYFGLADINDRPWKISLSSILNTQTIEEGIAWLLSHV